MRNLAMGQSGEVTATAQCKDAAGRWVTAPRPQKATRWKARVYIRGGDGLRQEIVRFARTRREAAIETAVEAALVSSDVPIRRSMTLLAAGDYWLQQIARPDSRLSPRTIADYTWTWSTYVDTRTSSLRGLTLLQANDPQRLRVFLQRVAEAHGSGSAKKVKSVLNGVLAYAVDSGVLASNAMRQVRTVTATGPRRGQRNHTRAMTRAERDWVVRETYEAANEPGLNPRTRRMRAATADFVAFLAGTGVRIDEARRLRWEQVDLERGRAYIRGTKSESSDRWLNLPDWLLARLVSRAHMTGTRGSGRLIRLRRPSSRALVLDRSPYSAASAPPSQLADTAPTGRLMLTEAAGRQAQACPANRPGHYSSAGHLVAGRAPLP